MRAGHPGAHRVFYDRCHEVVAVMRIRTVAAGLVAISSVYTSMRQRLRYEGDTGPMFSCRSGRAFNYERK